MIISPLLFVFLVLSAFPAWLFVLYCLFLELVRIWIAIFVAGKRPLPYDSARQPFQYKSERRKHKK